VALNVSNRAATCCNLSWWRPAWILRLYGASVLAWQKGRALPGLLLGASKMHIGGFPAHGIKQPGSSRSFDSEASSIREQSGARRRTTQRPWKRTQGSGTRIERRMSLSQ